LPDLARGPRDAQATSGSAGFDMDAYNARQVGRRASTPPSELLQEFLRGRAALITDVTELDEPLLGTEVRSAGGISGTLAGVIAGTAAAHVRQHSRDFLRAAGAELTSGQKAAGAALLAAEEAAQLIERAKPEQFVRKPSGEDWSAA